MLINKKGDVLKAEENLICHQVNTWGVMGGGLALQVAKTYPKVEKEYVDFTKKFQENLIGQYQPCQIADKKHIINCFTQDGFETDYMALEQVFMGLLDTCKKNKFTIAIPYKYGCGIATGDWNKVTEILEKVSNKFDIDINIYKLEGLDE